MKDFFNFRIVSDVTGYKEVTHTIIHNKRDDLSFDFKTGTSVHHEHVPQLIAKVMKAYSKRYASVTRKQLTPSQKRYYDMIVDFHKTEGRPPSYEEQCIVSGAKSKGTMWVHAQRLIEKGWLWKDEEGLIIPIDIALPHMLD